jgi:ferric enterobactin receptor
MSCRGHMTAMVCAWLGLLLGVSLCEAGARSVSDSTKKILPVAESNADRLDPANNLAAAEITPVKKSPLNRATGTTSLLDGVVELPEEVVQAGGLSFNARAGLRAIVPAREARNLPGGFADPTRYLQTLPGVTNDSDFDGELFIRGGEGSHNQILLDQVSVTDPYHFGSVVSFLNTDVIDRIEFMPSAYAADYGDAIGGVIKVDRRIGNLNQFRSSATLTSTLANVSVEGPLGNDHKGSWLLAGRRSHIDQFLSSRSVGSATLPYFYDIDARFYRQVGRQGIKLGFLRSGDAVSARMSDQFTFAPPDSSGLTWDRTLTMASLNWEFQPGSWNLTQAAAYSWRDQGVHLHDPDLPQEALEDTRIFDWRGDANLSALGLTWGSGAQFVQTHTSYVVDVNQLSLEQTDRRSNPRSPVDTIRTTTAFEGRNLYSAAYAQVGGQFFNSTLSVLVGGRLEHTSRTGEIEPTPRLRVEWQTPVGVLLTGAAGSYRQFPGHRIESDPVVGNAGLQAERARHLLLGAALPISRGGRISVEAYHKKLNDLIAVDADAGSGEPRFYNSGSGVARGVEFLFHLPRPRWNVMVSYTMGEVRYQDAADLPEYAPAQDIRHIISLVGQVRPLKHWTLGMKWRAHSGRPYTPIIGRQDVSEFVEDVVWIPVIGEYHSARFPWYHRLDVRAEREFHLGKTRLSGFLEVINLYGRRNLFDYRYVDGYGRAQPVQMLPWLPTFGLSVSF